MIQIMEINLLPKRHSKIQKAWLIWGFALLILLATVIIVWIEHSQLQTKKNNLQQELDLLSRQTLALQIKMNTIDPRSNALKQYQADIKLLDDQRVDWRSRLQDVSNLLPKIGGITNFSYQGSEIDMDGKLDSIEAVANYTQLIKKLKWVSDVTIQSIAQEGIDGSPSSDTTNGSEPYTFSLAIHTTDQPLNIKNSSNGTNNNESIVNTNSESVSSKTNASANGIANSVQGEPHQ